MRARFGEEPRSCGPNHLAVFTDLRLIQKALLEGIFTIIAAVAVPYRQQATDRSST